MALPSRGLDREAPCLSQNIKHCCITNVSPLQLHDNDLRSDHLTRWKSSHVLLDTDTDASSFHSGAFFRSWCGSLTFDWELPFEPAASGPTIDEDIYDYRRGDKSIMARLVVAVSLSFNPELKEHPLASQVHRRHFLRLTFFDAFTKRALPRSSLQLAAFLPSCGCCISRGAHIHFFNRITEVFL
jgi:hypothetical protein